MRFRPAVALALAASLSILGSACARATSGQAPSASSSNYHTNFKAGTAGWTAGGGAWTVKGTLLTNTVSDASTFLAPHKVGGRNYAVDATIRLVAWRHSDTSENNLFGVLFRGQGQGSANPATGLVGGVARGFLGCDGLYSWAGVATADTDTEVLKETYKFRPGYGWHKYRVEVRGNKMRVLVDGHLRNSVTSKTLASQTAVGLYALAAHIQVRDFRVVGL